MTISAAYSPDTYSGDGATTTFAITFSFLSVSTNVKVSIKDTNGTVTLKTAGTHYNISGSNVVFTAGNIPSATDTVIIELDPDFTQDSDYTENSNLPAETLETDLDERTLESQFNKDQAVRAVRVDAAVDLDNFDATLPTPAADKYIGFNATATGLVTKTVQELGTVTIPVPVADGGTGSTSASSALTALGGIGAATTDTLTNKTIVAANNTLTIASTDLSDTANIMLLDTAQEHTKTKNFNMTTLTSSSNSVAWDLSTNQVAKHTMTENTTLAAPTNQVAGATYLLIVVQDSTTRTMAFNSTYKFPGGTAPTISTGSGEVDIISFVSDGTNMYATFSQDLS